MKTPFKDNQNKLISFLKKFPNLDDKTILKLAEMIPVIAPKKGTVLLKEGEVPTECYYVLSGLIRQYQIIDGVERTTEFYYESNSTVSSKHFSEQSPSKFYLECVEECLLISGTIEIEKEHYEQFPELIEITKNILEQNLNQSKDNFSTFILSSPKERYLNFLKTHPSLPNRVPLHQIASYLGMTPESLSRIRKRIVSSSK